MGPYWGGIRIRKEVPATQYAHIVHELRSGVSSRVVNLMGNIMHESELSRSEEENTASSNFETSSETLEICLYVNGKSAISSRVVERLKSLLDRVEDNSCEMKVVDVSKDPSVLETANILVIPTLVRLKPEPPYRIVGDMTDNGKLVESLFPGRSPLLN